MKRMLTVLLTIALLLPCAALADIDLTAMTVEDLLLLRQAINVELIARGWEKEVRVPSGRYTVGEDIPAGVYTIRPDASQAYISVYDANGDFISNDHMTKKDGEYVGKITLLDTQIVEIGNFVIFAPYVGLGF